jgi:hypothetical protein
MKNTLITLTVLASLSAPALAKGTADPKLPKEVQPIHCMVGTWTGKNVQVVMAGKKAKGDIAISCSPTAGGFGVMCTAKITVEGMGTIEETDLFGWDPQAKLYHWYAVTSMGDTHDHVAMPPTAEGQPVIFAQSGFQDGKPMQEVLRLGFNADGTKIDFRNDGVIAGQSAWTIVATLVKK